MQNTGARHAPAQFAVAADIGGTNIRAAVVSRDGKVLARYSTPTYPERGIEDAAARLAALIEKARAAMGGEAVAGIGISTAGPVEPSTGIYNHPPNLSGWHNRTMRPALGRLTGLNVWVGHDATLAALAETRHGANQGVQNLIYVTLSTGIGGGIIANGEMVTGATGHAGEMGHITVRPGAQKCNVGCDGCFEGNASGPAIARLAATRLRAGEKSKLLAAAGGDPDKVTSRMVFDAAESGDTVALSVVDLAIDNIGIGLSGLLNIFDPEALVIGGGVVEGLRGQFKRISDSVLAHSLPHYRDKGSVPLSVTTLGEDVSIVGAAVLAFRRADGLG